MSEQTERKNETPAGKAMEINGMTRDYEQMSTELDRLEIESGRLDRGKNEEVSRTFANLRRAGEEAGIKISGKIMGLDNKRGSNAATRKQVFAVTDAGKFIQIIDDFASLIANANGEENTQLREEMWAFYRRFLMNFLALWRNYVGHKDPDFLAVKPTMQPEEAKALTGTIGLANRMMSAEFPLPDRHITNYGKALIDELGLEQGAQALAYYGIYSEYLAASFGQIENGNVNPEFLEKTNKDFDGFCDRWRSLNKTPAMETILKLVAGEYRAVLAQCYVSKMVQLTPAQSEFDLRLDRLTCAMCKGKMMELDKMPAA
jgi:hypothetical protein